MSVESLLSAIKVFVHQHPWFFTLIIAYGLICVIVAVTPKKYQQSKWYGWALYLFHRISILAHSDQIGSIQIPVIAKSVMLSIEQATVDAEKKQDAKKDGGGENAPSEGQK